MGNQGFDHVFIETVFKPDETLREGIEKICQEAEKAARAGTKILIISDRNTSEAALPIPSLLALGAVQHHLIRQKLRSITSLVVHAADVVEVHHYATLIGYGASAVVPYLVYSELEKLAEKEGKDFADLSENYVQAVCKGLLKVMSKMGISTLQSYQAAQIFEAVGLSKEVVDVCFEGTVTRVGGNTFAHFEEDIRANHVRAFQKNERLKFGGVYAWRRGQEEHLFDPKSIHLLQKATKLNDYALFKEYSQYINSRQERLINLRHLLDFDLAEPIPIDEVESVENILTRFATGAMSFGSISHEAHTTLAIAMNRIGAKSNSGEGGEDERRYAPKENGDSERSRIKQVASGRFGVNSWYLNNADEIQIKIAQGAKPGEGGQLPGFKVDAWIARVRNSTPGVDLISPPPHHDIYSIEDLAQLIFDLKNANPHARINVKLVSLTGVGTIAAGVAKAYADAILISGGDGGTGASPLSSIRHAGLPWEIGLAGSADPGEKSPEKPGGLQTNGKLLTGRDIAVATLLGAEEWGVSTAALITRGLHHDAKCHLNTCPVGIATQGFNIEKAVYRRPRACR
ncbi:MAG: glutamate synthase-related protein [Bacteroidia bacterium]